MAKYRNWDEYVKDSLYKKKREEKDNSKQGMTTATTWDEFVSRNKPTGFGKTVKSEPMEEVREEDPVRNPVIAPRGNLPANKLERKGFGEANERAKGSSVRSMDRKNFKMDERFADLTEDEAKRYEVLKNLDPVKADDYINQMRPVIAKRKAESGYVASNLSAGARQTTQGMRELGRQLMQDFGKTRDLTPEEQSRLEAEEVFRNRLGEINEDRSAAGKFGADVLQGIGQSLPGMAMATLNPALGLGVFAAGAAGNYLKEAEQAGASKEHKWAYGIAMGTVEAALERALGMFGFNVDGAVMPLIRQGLKKNLGTLAKHFAKNAAGEGAEEAASEIIGALMQKATYDPDRKLDGQLGRDALYSGAVGAASGAGMYMGQMPGNIAAAKYGPEYLKSEMPKAIVAAMALPESYESNKIVAEMVAGGNDISVGELEKLNRLIERDMQKYNEEIKSGKFDAEIFRETMRENNEDPDEVSLKTAEPPENEKTDVNIKLPVQVTEAQIEILESPKPGVLNDEEVKTKDAIRSLLSESDLNSEAVKAPGENEIDTDASPIESEQASDGASVEVWIKDYAKKLHEKNPNISEAKFEEMGKAFAEDIKDLNFDSLHENLHQGNKERINLFNKLTGQNAKTDKEIKNVIRALDPQAYDKWDAARKEKVKKAKAEQKAEEDKHKEEVKNAEKERVGNRQINWGGKVFSISEFVKMLNEEGYKYEQTNNYGGYRIKKGNEWFDPSKVDKEIRKYVRDYFRELAPREETEIEEAAQNIVDQTLPAHVNTTSKIPDDIRNRFKDSKLVNEDGTLMTLYHGTQEKFDELTASSAPGWGYGIYLTDNQEAALDYGSGETGRILSVVANLKNPYLDDFNGEYSLKWDELTTIGSKTKAFEKYNEFIEDEEDGYVEHDGITGYWESDFEDLWSENGRFANAVLRELGYDGVIAKGSNNIDGLEIVVFHAENVHIIGDNSQVSEVNSDNEKQNEDEAGNLELGIKEKAVKTYSQQTDELSEILLKRLDTNEKLSNKELFEIANGVFGGTQGEEKYNVKDAYDSLELAINKYILGMAEIVTLPKMQSILDLLPTQSNRTDEQEQFQQFSTPPSIAYVANFAANIGVNDVMLEPSAGIGGLAVFAKKNGAKVYVNEFSKRRLEIIRNMPFDGFFNENAEQLHNILPDHVKPSVIVMNPPFSATAGRMKDKNSTKYAKLHIEQALKRLEKDGRLVAIVGRGMAHDSTIFRSWWKDEIGNAYNIRANIGVDGKNYAKYGTTFDIQIVVIDKNGPTQGDVLTGYVEDISELPIMLEGIRNDRKRVESKPIVATDHSNHEGTQGTRGPLLSGNSSGSGMESGESGIPSQNVRGSLSGNTAEVAADSAGENVEADDDDGRRKPRGTGKGNVSGTQRSGVSGLENVDASGNDILQPARTESIGIGSKTEEESRRDAENLGEDEVYSNYMPKKLKIDGAKPHITALVESAAMAAVEPPNPTYSPKIDSKIVEEGRLTLPQLESVVYAGQSHQKILASGERQGFFIGDGTGVGKGAQISGIIMDNFNQGRKKAVWISMNNKLFTDAIRDWIWLGGSEKQLIQHKKIKSGEKISQKEGVLFSTYPLISSKNKYEHMTTKERARQIIDWLGKDFDGVIVFDEAHNMGNAVTVKKKRGKSNPSGAALAGIEIQKMLPKARIVYASATAATDINQLAYATRLGLWGQDTAFKDVGDFIAKIESGGLAALELVARDMKSMGLYLARNLSFDGVEYDTLTHELNDMQRMIYSKAAEAWQIVLGNIDNALMVTNANKNSQARKNALGQFWSANQRFFNQVMTSMSVPSLIRDVKNELSKGNVAVIQLVNTNEAAQNRGLSKAQEEEIDLEDLDMSPSQILVDYLMKSFPIQQYEDYMDDDGTVKQRPVVDSNGKPVINKEAQAKRDELVAEVQMMKMPDGAMDMIIDEFGTDLVAEITGRKRRLVYKTDPKTGRKTRVEEKRTDAMIEKDVDHFQNGDKKILIFSDAGGTGKSYHADKRVKNQAKRIHYLLQAGWNAIKATQGFGRSHRSNQVIAPTIRLVTTDLKGQKRFVSTIARRLNQLGAITKGQRQTGSGIFSEKDNLEGPLASDILAFFYEALANERFPEIRGRSIIEKMGLTAKMYDKNGVYRDGEDSRNIPLFLNRLLNLDYDDQNSLFDVFIEAYEDAVNRAIENGTLDTGLENYKAERVEFIDKTTIFEDQSTSAKTEYIQLKAYRKAQLREYRSVTKHENFIKFVQLAETGEVRAVLKSSKETDSKTGEVKQKYRLLPPIHGGKENVFREDTMKDKTVDFPEAEWRDLWQREMDKQPELKEETLHMLSGTLLPVWDKLPDKNARVLRVTDESGNVYLGRIFASEEIDPILNKFDIKRTRENADGEKVYDEVFRLNKIAQLGKRMVIQRRRVSGELRIEVSGPESWYVGMQYKGKGVFTEKISYQDRVFISTEKDKAVKVLDALIGKYEFESFATSMEADQDVPLPFQGKSPDKLGIVPPSFAVKIVPMEAEYKFEDSLREQSHRKNRLQRDTIASKLRSMAEEFRNIATRTFRGIDENDSSLAEARKELINYKNMRRLASDEALRYMNYFVQADAKELSKEEYNRFERFILLRDLMEDIENELTLPGSWTEDMVNSEFERLSSSMNDNIMDAVKRRDAGLDQIKNDYIKAMGRVGFNVKNRFKKEHYFRHMVLDYYNANEMIKGSGSRVKVNMNRGNLKRREGTEREINENYLEAEYEVLFNLLYDTRVAKMLDRIRKRYDISKKLKRQAKAQNEAKILSIAEAELQAVLAKLDPGRNIKLTSFAEYTDLKNQTGLNSDTADAMVKFNQRIAIAFGNLQELAKRYLDKGEGLWSGDGRWDSVIEDLASGKRSETNELFNYLSELASDELFDGNLEARSILAGISKRETFIKEKLSEKYLEWRTRVDERLIPEDYEAFQPIQGKHMMSVNTINDQMAETLMRMAIGETIGSEKLESRDLKVRQMLAFAGDRLTYIIPEPVSFTLGDVYSSITKEDQMFKKMWGKGQTSWKSWMLQINPRQVVKYNIRNITGDLDALIGIGSPAALKYVGRSSRELYEQIKFESFTPELKEFFERGGFQSDIIAQEIMDVNSVKLFKNFKRPGKFDRLLELPRSYVEFTGNLTRHREAVLRYSMYLHFKDLLKESGGTLKYYHASNPNIVRGLHSIEDKAFQLSNDVMGAYDQVTELGQGIRKYLMPFYSFQETNFKRYFWALKNAKDNEKLNLEIGKSISRKLQIRLGTKAAVKLGYIMLRIMMLSSVLEVWNRMVMREEDDELPDDIRTRPHLTLGRHNGEVVYFSRLGALTDLMDWFGLDTLTEDLKDLNLNRMTWEEMIRDKTTAPMNKIVNMISPFIKSPFELAFNYSVYPDYRTPSRIRDDGQYIAQSLGLREEYDRLKRLPVRSGYMESFIKAFVYTSDPGQAAYYKAIDLKSQFEKIVKNKTPSYSYQDSAKSKALYYMKLALKYGDEKNAKKFLEQYYENGGTEKGLNQSLSYLDPMYGLNKEEFEEFMNWLTSSERETIMNAIEWYQVISLDVSNK